MQNFEHAQDLGIGNPIAQHLPLAAIGDEALLAQLGEVLRQRRLADADTLDECADRQFARGGKMAHYEEAGPVGERSEQPGDLVRTARHVDEREC